MEPQTVVEDIVLISLNPEVTGHAARHAEQQKARRPPTEGSGNSSTSPNWCSAVYSPHSPAHNPYYPRFTPRSLSRKPRPPRTIPATGLFKETDLAGPSSHDEEEAHEPGNPRYQSRPPSYEPGAPQLAPQRLFYQSGEVLIEEVYVSQESAGEEDPSWKVSASEEEEQRHPGRSSRGGPAPLGGRTGSRAKVENVVPTGLNPGLTGPAARPAE